MSANGISDPAKTKQQRQVEKLNYSQAKRKGQIITEGSGTWSADGIDNPSANWYRATNDLDITLLPNPYNGNIITDSQGRTAVYDEFNGTGGEIQSVSITTPYTRSNGSAWNPAITTIRFEVHTPTDNPTDLNQYTYQPLQATGTPVFDGSNHLSGINITYSGAGYKKYVGSGYQVGQVIVDIFIIQDNSTGDPDSREIKNTTDININVIATDITYVGLQSSRPWA